MPTVTNVSRRVIHVGDTMLIPSKPADVSDKVMSGKVMQAYVDAGDVQMGEIKVKAEVEQPETDDDDKPKPQAPRAAPQPAPVKKA